MKPGWGEKNEMLLRGPRAALTEDAVRWRSPLPLPLRLPCASPGGGRKEEEEKGERERKGESRRQCREGAQGGRPAPS